jgi:hypothetical protein
MRRPCSTISFGFCRHDHWFSRSGRPWPPSRKQIWPGMSGESALGIRDPRHHTADGSPDDQGHFERILATMKSRDEVVSYRLAGRFIWGRSLAAVVPCDDVW